MNIKPVKNYKKPNYAKGLALTLATVTTLSGCEDPFALEGDVAVMPDNSDTEIVSDRNDITAEGTIVTKEDITDVSLDGDIAFSADNTETEATEKITTTTIATFAPTGTVVTESDEEYSETTAPRPSFTDTTTKPTHAITTTATTSTSLMGTVVTEPDEEYSETTVSRPTITDTTLPPVTEEDEPDLEDFVLEGDVAYFEETEEAFMLDGDVAVEDIDDNSGYETSDNSEEHINSAYFNGLDYASDIKDYLDKNDRPVNLHADMSYLLETGDNGDFTVPIALEGSKYNMLIAFYDSENPDDPLEAMLINASNASKVLYGYTVSDEFGATYFYIDLKALRNNDTEEIASAICLEEVTLI